MAICLLAIAAMIIITVLATKNPTIDPPIETPIEDPIDTPVDKPIDTPVDKPVVTPVVMVCPVNNPVVGLDYAMDSLVWHATLNHYAVNDGITFLGNDGDSVMAAYAGVIQSIDYDVLNGYTIVIKHNDKISSSYSSLNEPTIAVGQAVAKGEKIGTMGNTATSSYLSGSNVHFSVYENSAVVSPYLYLEQGNK